MTNELIRKPDFRALDDDQMQDLIDLCAALEEYEQKASEDAEVYGPLLEEAVIDWLALTGYIPNLYECNINIYQLALLARLELRVREWRSGEWARLLVDVDLYPDTDEGGDS